MKTNLAYPVNARAEEPQSIGRTLSKRSAFHEAGHAAAIYLGNNQKGLPPVHFRIVIQQPAPSDKVVVFSKKILNRCFAKIEGGQLITDFPQSMSIATKSLSDAEKEGYELAFCADIINLLAGPIAEAKYVALRDGEAISPRLVNLRALRNYGGENDLATLANYFLCLDEPDADRERKIIELFLSAYAFVNDRKNWRAITELANYLETSMEPVIEYGEIAAVLELNADNKLVTH